MPTVFHRLLPDFSPRETKDTAFVPALVAESSLVDLILVECHREVNAAGLVFEPYTREPTSKHWLDLGGIAWAGRKLYELEVDGLKLTVPAKDVLEYHECAAQLLGRKEFANSSVHVWLPRSDITAFPVCAHHVPVHPVDLWLWPHQMDELATKLGEILAEAEAIATAENQRHNEQLAEGQRYGLWTGKPRRVGRSEDA